MANFPSVLTKHFRDSGYDPTDNRAYLPAISELHKSPVVFVPIELPTVFQHQTEYTEQVQTNTFRLGKLNENTLIHSIDVHLVRPVSDFRIRISNLSTNTVLGYYPSLSDWNNNTGSSIGSGLQTIHLTSIMLPSESEIAFDFEGTDLAMLGENDKPYIVITAQRGTLKTITTDDSLSEGDAPINHRGIHNEVLEALNNVSDIEMAQSNIVYCDPATPMAISLPVVRKGNTDVLEANEVRSGHSWIITNVGSSVIMEINHEIYNLDRNRWIGLVAYLDQQQNPQYIITCSGSV